MTDFTYVSTRESWLYIAFVLDVYSRVNRPGFDALLDVPRVGCSWFA